jgi:hypothetical protein
MGHLVVMVLLEDKQCLGKKDCDVPIFGFSLFAVVGDPWGLGHPEQRVKQRLTVSSKVLRG